MRRLDLVSHSSSPVREGALKAGVATSETSSQATTGTVSGNGSTSYGRGVRSRSKEATIATEAAESTKSTIETSSETTSAAIVTE